MIIECGAIGGMRTGKWNRITQRKPAPMPVYPPKSRPLIYNICPNGTVWLNRAHLAHCYRFGNTLLDSGSRASTVLTEAWHCIPPGKNWDTNPTRQQHLPVVVSDCISVSILQLLSLVKRRYVTMYQSQWSWTNFYKCYVAHFRDPRCIWYNIASQAGSVSTIMFHGW
jgi:hypothetical protein